MTTFRAYVGHPAMAQCSLCGEFVQADTGWLKGDGDYHLRFVCSPCLMGTE